MSELDAAPFSVALEQAEQANLLGLLIQGLLGDNLARAGCRRRVRSLQGRTVFVGAGQMGVTLRFDEGGVTIATGSSGRPEASVRGSMTALLGMVTGQSGLVWPVLSGKVKIRGNPFLLLRMLPLIRVGG